VSEGTPEDPDAGGAVTFLSALIDAERGRQECNCPTGSGSSRVRSDSGVVNSAGSFSRPFGRFGRRNLEVPLRSSTPLAIAAFTLSLLSVPGPSSPFPRTSSARGDAPGAGAAVASNQLHGVTRFDVDKVEQQVLAARRAITTGEFEVAVAPDARGRKTEDRFHTWVSRDGRIRSTPGSAATAASARSARCQGACRL
jgi:hypothetical protein